METEKLVFALLYGPSGPDAERAMEEAAALIERQDAAIDALKEVVKSVEEHLCDGKPIYAGSILQHMATLALKKTDDLWK